MDREDFVLFETDELILLEQPTLDVDGAKDRFDVFDRDELLDETVHVLGEELGTLVDFGETSSGDRVVLVEKPADEQPLAREELTTIFDFDGDPGFKAKPVSFTVDFHPSRRGPTAEQIVDEIDDMLEDPYGAVDVEPPTSGEWRSRIGEPIRVLGQFGAPDGFSCGFCGGDHPGSLCPKYSLGRI